MSESSILVAGAREHNLRNITVEIPRSRMTVITGLSGSGKSSLAFDTLYAEGQRKYVESLSAYARQFLNQLQKPDVDHIRGLSPAIAIEQRTAGTNPRSIVATSTEIHDYLRLLFSAIGKQHCPVCGRLVGRQSVDQIVNLLASLPDRSRLFLLAPVVVGKKGRHESLIEGIKKQGFVRVRINGEIYEVEEAPALAKNRKHTIEIVVDRMIVTSRIRPRLTDSVELALKHGNGTMKVLSEKSKGKWDEFFYSEKHACPVCGISFEEFSPRHFSFNSPYGACPGCSGIGAQLVFDEDLIVPDPSISIDDGAITAWRRGGRRLIIYYKRLLRSLSKHYGFSTSTPYKKLSPRIRKIIMYGSGDEEVEQGFWRSGSYRRRKKPFEGVIPNLQRRYDTTDSDYTRQRLRRYMSRQHCPECKGKRLKPEVLACTINGKSIHDVAVLSIKHAAVFFAALKLNRQEDEIARELLKEIRARLGFLKEVGLGYLTLDRESGTLSGGEAQRIRLATQIGSGLVGVLYVLDEPTIGLHRRDNARLIKMLKRLRDLGNTVVLVEHDDLTIKEADHIIDLGPGAGRHGGRVIFEGTVSELMKSRDSLTAKYLNGEIEVSVPGKRRKRGRKALRVLGARENNLKNIDVSFPVGVLTCVTGVSGSGKSTLVDEILRRALFRKFYGSKERPGLHRRITGTGNFDKVIVIDQSPIGRTPRSNPATYTGAFGEIRKLFASTRSSKVRGYGPGRFSFNVKGGRCEACKGDGLLRLEMHFLPDVYVTCEQCGGERYNSETLEIDYKGMNIAQVLSMTIDDALDFFGKIPAVQRRFKTLSEVGLGYLQLGQPATQLSGGEAQRVKLATELSKMSTGSTLYMLDEPTTGLHFADTHRLLDVLGRLRDAGNTVIVIEHNPDVIKYADHIIDLGPEGGDNGGRVVVAGSPEEVAESMESHTGKVLREIFVKT